MKNDAFLNNGISRFIWLERNQWLSIKFSKVQRKEEDFKLHFVACLNERVDGVEKQWNIRVRKTNLNFGRHGFYGTIKLKLI